MKSFFLNNSLFSWRYGMSRVSIRKLFSLVLVGGVVLSVNADSQRTAVNSIYGEGLGPALLYSFNYERLVINDLGVRIGMSYMSFSATAVTNSTMDKASVAFLTFPITASYLGISSGSHIFELGGGTTLIYASGSASGVGVQATGSGMGAFGDILMGYRIHPVNGGFQFRVGFAGLFGNGLSLSKDASEPATFGFIPWFYLSFGGCFK
jgi:hypothetical protein